MAKEQFKIEKKKSGRFAVKKRGGGYVNGEEKVKILAEKGHIKLPTPKKKEAEAEESQDS